MVGIFAGLYQEKLVNRAEELGVERGRIGWFEKFLAAMHPDGAVDLATLTTSKIAEPGYAGILRLHTWSIEKGLAASSDRGDEYQDTMREAISDTIRSAGRQLRSNNTDERFVVQFQMRLLGGGN